MLSALHWLRPRRRTDSATACARIEPTLPDPLAPVSGRVRLRLRYNDAFAVALTEQEAVLHGIGTDGAWSDCRDAHEASREIVLDVPVPRFAEPAAEPIRATPVVTPPLAAASPVATPAPALSQPMQPTPPQLSPTAHAERLLAWCRRRGLVGEVIIFDIERAYAAMCAEEGLRPRPWNPISRELTVLLTGRVGVKHYTWSHEGDGAHKRRVFRIPAAEAVEAPGRVAA